MTHQRHTILELIGMLLVAFAVALTACSDAPPTEEPPDDCPSGMTATEDGACVSPACTPEGCERGVCAPAEGCVDASDCAGDDARCLSGSFCGDDNTCQRDLCQNDAPECTRGVCEPASGQCVDADTCDTSRECRPGSRCLDDRCVPEAELCGESGCPEGRVCDYREPTHSAECVEATPCQTSRDCFDGRVCAGNQCMSAPVCEPDDLEPNDDQSTATDFQLVANQDALDATVCGDDRDVYRLEITPPEDSSSRRELTVVVEFPRREVGLGRLSATLLDPQADAVASETSDDDGNIVIKHALSLANTGTYHVVVEADGPLGAGGLHYRLVARDMPRNITSVCQGAQTIAPGESISGNTSGPSTSILDTRCSAQVPDASDLYALDIEQPSLVDVRLTTTHPQNFIIGLRADCARLDTELACTVGRQTRFGSSNTDVDLDTTALAPGRYFVTVQNPSSLDTAPYELQVSASSPACDPAANSCTTPSSSRTCDQATGEWDVDRCELGCQAHNGYCRPQMADTCESAPLLRTSGILPIDWDQLTSDYFIPEQSCLPSINRATNTQGPDAVYQVPLPAKHALRAKLTTDRPHDVSIYLLDDCLSPGDRCIAGTNAEYVETEELLYWNDSSSSQSLFLVVDAVEGTRGHGEFSASIDPILCEQWESRCLNDELQGCTPDRIGWNTIAQCQWGCSASSCNPPPGDTCSAAEPLSPGQTFSGVFSDYANSEASVIDHCVAFGSIPDPGYLADTAHDGPDAYFSVQLNQGDLLQAQLDSSADASLFVSDSCQPSAAQSCLFGDESSDTLEFYAPQAGTYYLAVDTAESGVSATFDLSIDVQSGTAICQPGGTHCDPTTGELVICDDQGTREVGRRTCANGCAPQACQAPSSFNNTCGSAYLVSGSARIVDDLNRFANDYDGASSCGVHNTGGSDTVYQVDLNPNEVLRASAQGVYGSHPSLYVVGNCADLDGTCKAGSHRNSTGGPSEVDYLATSQETVFLIVDRRYNPNDGQFLLDIEVRPVECRHGQTRCAQNTAGAGMDYCSDLGLWEPYACQGGCSSGECATPQGGICQDATVVTDGQTVTGDWSGQNNVELGQGTGAGVCQDLGPANSVGEDTFYRIELQQGDLLEVNLETPNQYAAVHFLESCTGIDTCQPSADTQAFYYAETSRPIWVMVDASRQQASSSYNPTYQATFDITAGAVCVPNKSRCFDSNTLDVCNDQGTAIASTYNCPGTCAQDACEASLAADTCASAPNIGAGILVYANPDDLSDDVTFGQQSCTTNGQSRPDLVYEVTVAANEVLRVKSNTARVILMDDCTDPDGTCFEFDNPPTSLFGIEPDGLFWSPEQTRTIKVVADVLVSNRPVRLQIDKLPVECSAGGRQCAASGDAIEVCEPWGLWRSTDCQTTCTNGRCDVPTGEYCDDPIELSAGMSVQGSFADFNDDVSMYFPSCTYGRGRDAVYEMELTAGDILDAKLLSTAGATLSILEGCTQSGFEACLQSSMGERDLMFVAPSTGTYFLMVAQESSWTPGDDFLLEVDVQPGGVCTPNTSRCDDSADLAEVCNDDGTAYDRSYVCAGGCNGDACAPPTVVNDTCASAHAITSGTVIADNFGSFNEDYLDPASCGGTNLRGQDSVYQVGLQQGEVLWAELTSPTGGNTALSPHLLVSDQCIGPSTCLAHSAEQNGVERRSAEVTYHAPVDQTVYLFVDAEYSSTLPYRLELDIAPAECTPGAAYCVDADTLEQCPHGRSLQRACAFGCNNGACNSPVNDVCSGATPVARDGNFHTRNVNLVADYTGALNLGSTINTCPVYGTPGPDAIYRLDAEIGDVFTAYWPNYPGMFGWLTSDCANASQSCMDAARDGFLEQTIPATGTYWFVLDSDTGAPDETIPLDVRLAPTICQPGQSTCNATSGVITYCNAAGTDYKDYACHGGCDTAPTQPRCLAPRGEQCIDAIDASQGGVFSVDVTRFDNTFSHIGSGCMPSGTIGGDAIYRVDLAAGETVEAVTTPPQGDAAALFILDNCHTSNPESACLTGNSASNGQSVTARYTATSAQTVYVVVDSSDSSASASWSVDISVQ